MEHKEELLAVSASSEVGKRSKKRLSQCAQQDGVDDDLMDKKRRLTVEQINYLEMSFNADLKLEPDRKALIAKELGLRPRQVAIWFQNRRARWKNKQVEQDYETLKVKHDDVVKENENLIKECKSIQEDNKRLRAEVDYLKNLLRGGMDMDATSVLSSLKDEQRSIDSELASPTKSADCQSEIVEILLPSEKHEAALGNLPSQELNGMILWDDMQWPPFSENVFGSLPVLVQQLIANGHCFEDAYNIHLEYEYFGGWR